MAIRSQWFRSKIKLDGDMIVPIPPFESYDPFDWYYPLNEIRQGDKSLYLEFLAANNKEEAVRFCERFGVLGSSKKLLDKPYQKMGNPNVIDIPPGQLCRPMTTSAFEKIRMRFVNELHFPEDPSPTLATAEKEAVANFINKGIRASGVHSYMNWDVQTGQYETAYSSLDLTGIFFQMAKLDLLGGGKILPCPRCENPFVTGSDRVRFCSFPCYNAYTVREHHRKKKALAAQKGKKATNPSTRNK